MGVFIYDYHKKNKKIYKWNNYYSECKKKIDKELVEHLDEEYSEENVNSASTFVNKSNIVNNEWAYNSNHDDYRINSDEDICSDNRCSTNVSVGDTVILEDIDSKTIQKITIKQIYKKYEPIICDYCSDRMGYIERNDYETSKINFDNNEISDEAPLAKVLCSHRENDIFAYYDLEGNKMHYKILKVSKNKFEEN